MPWKLRQADGRRDHSACRDHHQENQHYEHPTAAVDDERGNTRNMKRYEEPSYSSSSSSSSSSPPARVGDELGPSPQQPPPAPASSAPPSPGTVGKAQAADVHELECGGSSDPRVRRYCRAFVNMGKSAKKNLDQPHPGPGGNLEDHHEELECQRRQQLLNSVLGKNLEDLHDDHDHEERDCQRSARRETRRSALPPTVPPPADDEDRSPPSAPDAV